MLPLALITTTNPVNIMSTTLLTTRQCQCGLLFGDSNQIVEHRLECYTNNDNYYRSQVLSESADGFPTMLAKIPRNLISNCRRTSVTGERYSSTGSLDEATSSQSPSSLSSDDWKERDDDVFKSERIYYSRVNQSEKALQNNDKLKAVKKEKQKEDFGFSDEDIKRTYERIQQIRRRHNLWAEIADPSTRRDTVARPMSLKNKNDFTIHHDRWHANHPWNRFEAKLVQPYPPPPIRSFKKNNPLNESKGQEVNAGSSRSSGTAPQLGKACSCKRFRVPPYSYYSPFISHYGQHLIPPLSYNSSNTCNHPTGTAPALLRGIDVRRPPPGFPARHVCSASSVDTSSSDMLSVSFAGAPFPISSQSLSVISSLAPQSIVAGNMSSDAPACAPGCSDTLHELPVEVEDTEDNKTVIDSDLGRTIISAESSSEPESMNEPLAENLAKSKPPLQLVGRPIPILKSRMNAKHREEEKQLNKEEKKRERSRQAKARGPRRNLGNGPSPIPTLINGARSAPAPSVPSTRRYDDSTNYDPKEEENVSSASISDAATAENCVKTTMNHGLNGGTPCYCCWFPPVPTNGHYKSMAYFSSYSMQSPNQAPAQSAPPNAFFNAASPMVYYPYPMVSPIATKYLHPSIETAYMQQLQYQGSFWNIPQQQPSTVSQPQSENLLQTPKMAKSVAEDEILIEKET